MVFHAAHSPKSGSLPPKNFSFLMQILVAVLIAALAWLQYSLWIAEDGARQTQALRIAIRVQIEDNAELDERNRALEAEVEDLKRGLMAIEERARSDMGMIRRDETFFRLLDQPAPKPDTSSRSAKPPRQSSRPASP
jgi:cell division protein FtsB